MDRLTMCLTTLLTLNQFKGLELNVAAHHISQFLPLRIQSTRKEAKKKKKKSMKISA